MIKVLLHGTTDITPLVESATVSGDSTKFHRQLTLNLTNTNDGRKQVLTIDEGSRISLRYNNALKFVGIVFATDISSDGTMSITAYDSNIYLAKSNDSRIFVNKKASDIIRLIAKDFGIETGEIADTGYVIPYLRLADNTLFDMILKALTLTRKQTGRRFFISNDGGKLVLKGGADGQRYVFKDGINLISASYSRSIEDTKTQAKVIGGEKGKETVVVVKDDAIRQKYGVLQALEIMDEKATASQVKQRAQTILKEQSQVREQLNIDVLGVLEVDVGTPVYVQNEMTRTNGAYYVTSVSHEFSSDVYTMSLELTRTYELPDIDVSDDELGKEAK